MSYIDFLLEYYVWIIVDHGKEGIEGQVLNVSNSSTSYYVKIKD